MHLVIKNSKNQFLVKIDGKLQMKWRWEFTDHSTFKKFLVSFFNKEQLDDFIDAYGLRLGDTLTTYVLPKQI